MYSHWVADNLDDLKRLAQEFGDVAHQAVGAADGQDDGGQGDGGQGDGDQVDGGQGGAPEAPGPPPPGVLPITLPADEGPVVGQWDQGGEWVLFPGPFMYGGMYWIDGLYWHRVTNTFALPPPV